MRRCQCQVDPNGVWRPAGDKCSNPGCKHLVCAIGGVYGSLIVPTLLGPFHPPLLLFVHLDTCLRMFTSTFSVAFEITSWQSLSYLPTLLRNSPSSQKRLVIPHYPPLYLLQTQTQATQKPQPVIQTTERDLVLQRHSESGFNQYQSTITGKF